MKKKKIGYIIQVAFLLLLIVFGIWRQNNREEQLRESAFFMDTLIEIEIEGRSDSLHSILDGVWLLAESMEKEFSYYDPQSTLSEINAAHRIKLNEDFHKLVMKGEMYWQATAGRYDLTVGLLSELWDIQAARLPEKNEIEAALQLTGMNKLSLEENILHKPAGMKLNLGSIAKGYAVDRMVEYLQKKGIKKGLINAGGDLRFWGMGEIVIGVQHPRRDRGEVIDRLKLENKAVVTSGDYERSYEVDGVSYHHIIDAVSGYPADNCLSVTAICASAMEADALSTAAFLLPPVQAAQLADKINNAEVIIYYQDDAGDIQRLLSSGAAKYLENVQ